MGGTKMVKPKETVVTCLAGLLTHFGVLLLSYLELSQDQTLWIELALPIFAAVILLIFAKGMGASIRRVLLYAFAGILSLTVWSMLSEVSKNSFEFGKALQLFLILLAGFSLVFSPLFVSFGIVIHNIFEHKKG